jgi:hypothetical protein
VLSGLTTIAYSVFPAFERDNSESAGKDVTIVIATAVISPYHDLRAEISAIIEKVGVLIRLILCNLVEDKQEIKGVVGVS